MYRWKMVRRKESIPAAPTIPQKAKKAVLRSSSCHMLRPTWRMQQMLFCCCWKISPRALVSLPGRQQRQGRQSFGGGMMSQMPGASSWLLFQVHHPDYCIRLQLKWHLPVGIASCENEHMMCPPKSPSIGEYSKLIQQRGNSRELFMLPIAWSVTLSLPPW